MFVLKLFKLIQMKMYFTRCLWFMLEVLMTKNENNSHSFLRKMVENIKQTKDAQAPDDPKANEVRINNKSCRVFVFLNPSVFYSIFMHLQKLYIVCDVALFVIANKSTSCHLDSPKDPVLPSKFFTPPDKVTTNLTIHNCALHVT